MSIYADPRKALLKRLLGRFPDDPGLRSIIRKYRKDGVLSDREWSALKSMDVGDTERTLSPEFERQAVLWLMDLGLTMADVLELSVRRKGERVLDEEHSPPPRVLVMKKPLQAKSIQELRELSRQSSKKG